MKWTAYNSVTEVRNDIEIHIYVSRFKLCSRGVYRARHCFIRRPHPPAGRTLYGSPPVFSATPRPGATVCKPLKSPGRGGSKCVLYRVTDFAPLQGTLTTCTEKSPSPLMTAPKIEALRVHNFCHVPVSTAAFFSVRNLIVHGC